MGSTACRETRTAVGQSSSDYYQWLMRVALLGNQSVTTPTGVDGSQPTTSTSTAQSGTTASTGNGVSRLEDAIRSVVLNAIQEAEKSGNTSDLKTVIQKAVEQALKDAGIDPQTLQQQAEGQATQGAHHHHHHHHPEANGVDQGNGTDSTTSSQQTPSQQADSQTGVTGQTNGTGSTTSSQQTSNHQIVDLLLQLSGSSGSNQAITTNEKTMRRVM